MIRVSSRRLARVLTWFVLSLAAGTCYAQADRSLVETGRRATVFVFTRFDDAGAMGSGFCIDSSGLFVTNNHVVADKGRIGKVTITLSPGTAAAKTFPATVVKTNAEMDIAILRVDGAGVLNPVELASAGQLARLRETEPLIALGYPFGAKLSTGAVTPEISISTGKITALRHAEGELITIQFDGSINHGNSGGPLLDDQGHVIGVVTAIVPNKQINFAMPTTFIRAVLGAANIVLTPKALSNLQWSADYVEWLNDDTPRGRAAVPDAAAVAQSQKLVHELLAARYADKTPKGRAALVLDLMDRAQATKDDVAGRYALLTEARDAALAAGDVYSAIDASELLARRYQVKPVTLLTELVTRMAARVEGRPQDAAGAAAVSLLLAEAAAGRQSFADARKMTGLTRQFATAARNQTVQATIRDRVARIEVQALAYDRGMAALQKLKSDPKDEASNVAAGRYFWFVARNLDAAIPLFLKGNDAPLKALAAAEMAKPTAAAAQTELGNQWWDQATKEKTDLAAADFCKTRAAYWYRRAYTRLEGLSKTAVRQRLATLPPPPPATGPGLWCDYFEGDNFDRQVGWRIDSKICSDFGDGAPGPGAPVNHFSVRWYGYLKPPRAGKYRLLFRTDDGCRVAIDGHTILNQFGRHAVTQAISVDLTDRPQSIVFEMMDHDGSSHAAFFWEPPGETVAVVVPASCFFLDEKSAAAAPAPPAGGHGLARAIYNGENLDREILHDVDANIDWMQLEHAIAPGVPTEHYSINWHGYLVPPESGQYQITVRSDDGVMLWIDGAVVVEAWKDGFHGEKAMVTLDHSPHEIRVKYFQGTGPARISLHWSKADAFVEYPIPPSAFFLTREAAMGEEPPSAATTAPTTQPAKSGA